MFLDSELVVKQVNGQYKVKDAGLKPLHRQACLLLSKFHEVDVRHVRREQNAAADALVNQAIDAATLTLMRSPAPLPPRELHPGAASGSICRRCGCSSVG